MFSFGLLSLVGSASAGLAGPILAGPNHIIGEPAFVYRRAPGVGNPAFPAAPVFFKGNDALSAHDPVKLAGGPPLLQGLPVFFKDAVGHKDRFTRHEPLTEELRLGGFGGHRPLLAGVPIVLKHLNPGPQAALQAALQAAPHAAPQAAPPLTHGPPHLIIRDVSGLGDALPHHHHPHHHHHGSPLIRGGRHTVQGPTFLLNAGPGGELRRGTPIVLKAGLAGLATGNAIGIGHEQHAISGPSYLITTIRHVQKVSNGGKLIASFSGAPHVKSLAPVNFGHGGHAVCKGC